jgi:hypothetical protein
LYFFFSLRWPCMGGLFLNIAFMQKKTEKHNKSNIQPFYIFYVICVLKPGKSTKKTKLELSYPLSHILWLCSLFCWIFMFGCLCVLNFHLHACMHKKGTTKQHSRTYENVKKSSNKRVYLNELNSFHVGHVVELIWSYEWRMTVAHW